MCIQCNAYSIISISNDYVPIICVLLDEYMYLI